MYEKYKPSPKVIILTGSSGSGKTTLCKKIAEKYDYAHIEWDTLAQQIVEKENYPYDDLSLPSSKTIQRKYFVTALSKNAYKNIIIEGARFGTDFVIDAFLKALTSKYGQFCLIKPILYSPPLEIRSERFRKDTELRVQKVLSAMKHEPYSHTLVRQMASPLVSLIFNENPSCPPGFDKMESDEEVFAWIEENENKAHPHFPIQYSEIYQKITTCRGAFSPFYQAVEIDGVELISGIPHSAPSWDNINKLNVDWEGKNILDCGCNAGYFLFKAMEHGAASCSGYDIDAQALKIATLVSKYKNIPLSLMNNSIEDGIKKDYDIIMALNMLHYFSDPKRPLREICRHTNEIIIEIGTTQLNDILPVCLSKKFKLIAKVTSHRTQSSIGPRIILHLRKDI